MTDKQPAKKRRNSAGRRTETIAISIPKELNQTVNGIAVRDAKTRSRVISELIRKGLES